MSMHPSRRIHLAQKTRWRTILSMRPHKARQHRVLCGKILCQRCLVITWSGRTWKHTWVGGGHSVSLRIPYRIFESEELYSSTHAVMFHNGPPCTIRRSPYQRTLRYTSSLSYTHAGFEPRICLESRTWLLSNPPGKFHGTRWICARQW